jgi:hypothetical protein
MIDFINDRFDTVVLPVMFVIGLAVVILDLMVWRAM